MRIKHFAGYGCVNAKKLSTKRITDVWGDKLTEMKIEVWGNHERGLQPCTDDDAFSWLVLHHFGKQYSWGNLDKAEVVRNWYEELPNGVSEEYCEYRFLIK